MGLAPMLGVVVLVLTPAPAQAGRFFINGALATTKHEPNVFYGKVELQNSTLGKIKCENLASGNIWNEVTEGTERGAGISEGYTTYGCTAEPNVCPEGGIFATAENPVYVTEKEIGGKKERVAERGTSTLPWSGKVVEEEGTEKLTKIKTNGIKVTIAIPCIGLEVPFEGALEPIAINGVKNGLSPSKLQFQGKGGKTGFLKTKALGTGEAEIGYTIGEVASVGEKVELITTKK
jgi:hypothetical protein